MPGAIDLTGQKFSRLIVVRKADKNPRGESRWECICDCGSGKTVIAVAGNLKNQHTRSCGCLTKEANTTHNLYHSTEYRIWWNMKSRCYNEKDSDYSNYGGRGIVMCDVWKSDFMAFYNDMGPRPSKDYSIDRKDNDKGYSKDNCRWASRIEQANNRRTNLFYEHNGIKRTLTAWCRELGLNYNTVRARIGYGWSFEKAISN